MSKGEPCIVSAMPDKQRTICNSPHHHNTIIKAEKAHTVAGEIDRQENRGVIKHDDFQ